MSENEDLWIYLVRISTKRCDIMLHPLKGNPLIVQAKVEGPSLHSLGSLREAERAQAVVDRHK